MDWTNDDNNLLKELITYLSLISNDGKKRFDLEIEGELYVLIKLMKQNQFTKPALPKADVPHFKFGGSTWTPHYPV